MLVGAPQIFGDDPRIRGVIDADEAERDVGVPVSGFSSAMVRGRSSVRIRPSVSAFRVAGFGTGFSRRPSHR